MTSSDGYVNLKLGSGWNQGQDSRLDLVCDYCGKEFKRYKSQRVSKKVFCSPACHYKSRSVGITKRTITKPYRCARKQPKTCVQCGKSYVYKSHKRQKYCSRKCFEISHKERMKGSNNPAWINGASYNKRGYRGDNWEQQRMKCYKRDDFSCRICGVKCVGRRDYKYRENGNARLIQCHHIKHYESEADNGLENLITLCVSCHSKTHAGATNYD